VPGDPSDPPTTRPSDPSDPSDPRILVILPPPGLAPPYPSIIRPNMSLDIFDVCVYISNFLYLEIPESIRIILYECITLNAYIAQTPTHLVLYRGDRSPV